MINPRDIEIQELRKQIDSLRSNLACLGAYIYNSKGRVVALDRLDVDNWLYNVSVTRDPVVGNFLINIGRHRLDAGAQGEASTRPGADSPRGDSSGQPG